MESKLKVFISYASEDYEDAKKLYNDLKRINAVDPWLDRQNLLGGQNWEEEIPQRIKDSSYFLFLLSKHSVSKEGFVQKELKIALERLDRFLPGKIFIIPVRINDCSIPFEKLKKLHYIDLFPSHDDGIKKILKAINSSRDEAASNGDTEVLPGNAPDANSNSNTDRQLNFDQKSQLIEALLSCSTMSDRHSCDTVVKELPFKNNIPRNNAPRVDVNNIVNTCSEYPGGIKQLIDMVRFFEGDSNGMQKVDRVVRSFNNTFNEMHKRNKKIENSQMDGKKIINNDCQIDFVNRISELQYITDENCPPYLLISAPAGYGKTRLLKQAISQLEDKDWLCVYLRNES